MKHLPRAALLVALAMVGVGTCSTESVAAAQGDQPGGQQPVFESRLGVWLAGVARLVLLDASRREHFMAPFMSGPVREGPYLRTVPLGGADRLGLTVIELTRQLDEYFGTDGGVLISAVRHWSPADRAGLKAGDVVTRIEGHKVRTERDLAGALHRNLRGARLTVGVTRDGRNAVIDVRVPR